MSTKSGEDPVAGIFACNDELALGVCDALDWHLSNPRRKHFIKAAVVGFDGIRDVTGRIEKQMSYGF